MKKLMWATALIAAPCSAFAYDLGQYGKIVGDFRARYEYADDESVREEANARTARLRLGYQTPTWNGVDGFVEVESVQHLGPTEFNDGIVNNRGMYARVGDPEVNAINQLYVNYAYDKENSARLGRQTITFDNHRFIGWSRFRQNDTTHDAARLNISPLKDWQLTYAYSTGAHKGGGSRSPAGELEGNIHLLHSHNKLPLDLSLSVYTYLLGFENPGEANLASRTHGARLEWKPKGDGLKPFGIVDLAYQSDYDESNLNYSEGYAWLEFGGRVGESKVSAVYEYLGGDGTSAMQTPIATAHSMNGWADKFTTIPVEGLQDFQLHGTTPFALPWEGQILELFGQLHYYTSTVDSIDYGYEGGIGVTYKPMKDHAITAKVSHYVADERFADTTKFWLYYDIKF